MKVIKQIVESIEGELKGAEHYAKLATQYRDSDKQLADSYARIAQNKLGNVNEFHKHATRLIKEKNESGVETPASMQAVWDWEHGKHVDTDARVKSLLAVYRGE